MANIEKKSYREINDITRHIIDYVDYWIEGTPMPIIIYDVNPTVDEVCDAVKYVSDQGWLGNIIYAKKMVYVDDNSFDSSTCKTGIGLVITGNENDFIELEKGEHSYYRFINSFPEIIGVQIGSNNEYEKYDSDIYLKPSDDYRMTKTYWNHKYNMNLKENDPVMIHYDYCTATEPLTSTQTEMGIYTGVKRQNPDTLLTEYQIATNTNKSYLTRGINDYGSRFITFPEYAFIMNNFLEANARSLELFNKFNENMNSRKNKK